MSTHRVAATIEHDGTLTLNDLPFQAGDEVEVIILPRRTHANGSARYPLRGQSIQYDEPFAPVAEEDWGALQ